MSATISWLFVVGFCAVAYGAAILPEVIFDVVSRQRNPDPLWSWEHAPKNEIKVNLDGSAFGDYSKGIPNAPVQIVEFADFECPACRRLHSILKSVLEKFPGTYHVVFRNYPLDISCNPSFGRPMHPYACSAAFFSRCAGEQGKFWEAVDFLFHYEVLEGDAPAADVQNELIEVGSRDLMLDKDAVKECLLSGRYGQKIVDDVAEGNRIGLTGTPAVWINGKAVPNSLLLSLERVFAKILGLPAPPNATAQPSP
jgi:protein-disulfide isomerase